MEKKFFNETYFSKIVEKSYLYPNEYIPKIREYINQYPHDFFAYYHLAKIYLVLGRLDDAKKILKENNRRSRAKFASDKHRLDTLQLQNIIVKIKIDICEGNWEQALKDTNFFIAKLHESKCELYSSSSLSLQTFIKYHLGYPIEDKKFYFTQQLYDYSLEKTIKHILEHHQDENDFNNSMIYEYIDIKKLFTEISMLIEQAKKYYLNFTDETCYFKYDSIGLNSNDNCNFIMVKTIYGTNKILTGYPTKDVGGYEYIDLNYLRKEVETVNKEKPKQLSRIAKFKVKYNMK